MPPRAQRNFKLRKDLSVQVIKAWLELLRLEGAGIEKVLYPGILVTSQFQFWQPILGWRKTSLSPFENKQPIIGWTYDPASHSSISKEESVTELIIQASIIKNLI